MRRERREREWLDGEMGMNSLCVKILNVYEIIK
jgi:hypothetical protein